MIRKPGPVILSIFGKPRASGDDPISTCRPSLPSV